MIILITGASGFIGRALVDSLRSAGHRVIAASRHRATAPDSIDADFTHELAPAQWLPKLAGVDVVINAVGILREKGEQTFDRIHTRGPQALFAACARAGVPRIIQLSALGAESGVSGYFRSKRAADEYLSHLPVRWTIVQPSLVFGIGGASARLFTRLASLPVIPLPNGGHQRVQPIHLDELVTAIVRIATTSAMEGRRVALVGPEPVELKELLRRLRRRLQLSPPRFVTIPAALMRIGARVAEVIPGSLLDRETLAMLDAGNTASPQDTNDLLGRAARAPEQLIAENQIETTRQQAQLGWALPLLRVSIALVWIWTGIVSLGLYPIRSSYELLSRAGIGASLAPLMLYGATALDLALGVATLLMKQRRRLWQLQLTLILGYTLIISFKLPEFWLHPYGPLSKNLPLLAAIYLLYTLEARSWNTSS